MGKPDSDVLMANLQTNLAYIFAGCLQQACEDMDKYLKKVSSDLRFDNKRAINKVLDISKKLQSYIDDLEKLSILTCSDEYKYNHYDAVFKYYVIIMNIAQLAGSDDKAEIRLLMINNLIKKFETNTSFEILPLRDRMAFNVTRNDISNGKWDKEILRTCLKVKEYEDSTKSSENKG